MIIDAHQHFWRLERGDYYWLRPDLEPLYRDFLPEDLLPLLDSCGVDGTVLIQAAPTEAETDFMLDLANDCTKVKGVVGWIDMAATDAPDRLVALKKRGAQRFKGIRPMIQDIDNPDWILRRDLDYAFSAIASLGLTFDALVTPKHLSPLQQRLRRHPDINVVVDHAAKPSIASGEWHAWRHAMAALAEETSVTCKLSGLLTEAASGDAESVRPYARELIAMFGPDRVMWGSDWPVLTLAASYERWFTYACDLVEELAPNGRDWIFGKTAAAFYGL